MKKILLSVISVLTLSAVGVQAQNKVWNFTEFEAGSTSIIVETVIDDLTIGGADGKPIAFDKQGTPAEIDGLSLSGRLKFGGTGTVEKGSYLPTQRYISFPVTGSCTVTVYGASANTSDTRILNITDGSQLLGTLETLPIAKAIVEYAGEAGTIYMYSANSGFNIYYISVDYGTNGINDAAANKAVVSAEYYDITGRKVSENATGLIMKKLTYDDGTSQVVKTIVRK